MDERENALSLYALHDALRAQRVRGWAVYGVALRRLLEDDARQVPGLDDPIEIMIETTGHPDIHPDLNELAQTLIDNANAGAPSPADLPGNPLTRLEQQP